MSPFWNHILGFLYVEIAKIAVTWKLAKKKYPGGDLNQGPELTIFLMAFRNTTMNGGGDDMVSSAILTLVATHREARCAGTKKETMSFSSYSPHWFSDITVNLLNLSRPSAHHSYTRRAGAAGRTRPTLASALSHQQHGHARWGMVPHSRVQGYWSIVRLGYSVVSAFHEQLCHLSVWCLLHAGVKGQVRGAGHPLMRSKYWLWQTVTSFDVAQIVPDRGYTGQFPPIYFSEQHKNKARVPRHVLGWLPWK